MTEFITASFWKCMVLGAYKVLVSLYVYTIHISPSLEIFLKAGYFMLGYDQFMESSPVYGFVFNTVFWGIFVCLFCFVLPFETESHHVASLGWWETLYVVQAGSELEVILLWLLRAGIIGTYHYISLSPHRCIVMTVWDALILLLGESLR